MNARARPRKIEAAREAVGKRLRRRDPKAVIRQILKDRDPMEEHEGHTSMRVPASLNEAALAFGLANNLPNQSAIYRRLLELGLRAYAESID